MSREHSGSYSPANVRCRPVQETNVSEDLSSSGRNLRAQTIGLSPTPVINETTVQGNFNGQFSKSSTALDISQNSSLGDTLVDPLDAVQDNGPPAENYGDVLQQQNKRPRARTEDEVAEAAGYKRMMLEKEAEIRKWKATAEVLNDDNTALKDRNGVLKDENEVLKDENGALKRELYEATNSLHAAETTIRCLKCKVKEFEEQQERHCSHCEEPRDDLAAPAYRRSRTPK